MRTFVFVCLAALSVAAHGRWKLGVHTEVPGPTLEVLETLEPGGEPLTAVVKNDASEIVGALAGHEIDFALLEEPIDPIAGVSVVGEVYPSVLHVVYRSVSDATSVKDLLHSRAIWAGGRGGIGYRLASALAADYITEGRQARAVHRREGTDAEGNVHYHVLVEFPDGTTEDPSRALGMT